MKTQLLQALGKGIFGRHLDNWMFNSWVNSMFGKD